MYIFKKISRILLYIAVGILFIITVLHFFVDPVAKRLLEQRIKKTGNGQYTLHLDDLHISLWQGDILLKGIQVKTDTSRDIEGPLIFSEAEAIIVEGLSWTRIFTQNQLILENAAISNGSLQLTFYEDRKKDKNKEPFSLDQLDVYPQIKDKFEKVRIGNLNLENISFAFENQAPSDTLHISSKSFSFNSRNILVDESRPFTDLRTFYTERLNIEGKELEFTNTGPEKLDTRINLLSLNTRKNKAGVFMDSVKFLLHSKESPDTLIFFQLQTFLAQQLNFEKLYEEKNAELEKVLVNGLEFAVNDPNPGKKNVKREQNDTAIQESLKEFTIAPYLPALIQKLELKELEVKNMSGSKGTGLALVGGNVKAQDLVIDDSPAFANNNFIHSAELDSQVEQLILAVGEPLHHATFNHISFTFGKGISNLKIDHFSLLPSGKNHFDKWMEIETNAILLDNLNTGNIPEGVIELGMFLVENPEVIINVPSEHSPAKKRLNNAEGAFDMEQLDIYPSISPYLDKFAVSKVSIEDMGVKIIDRHQKLQMDLPHINLKSKDILIGEGEIMTASRTLYAQQLEINATNLSILQRERDSMEWGFSLGAVYSSIGNSQANTRVKSMEYTQVDKSGDDTLMSINLEDFQFKGLDIREFLLNQNAAIDLIALNGLDISLDLPNSGNIEPSEKDTIRDQKTFIRDLELGNYLPELIHKVNLKDLDIQNISFLDKQNNLKLEEGNLQANDIEVTGKGAFAENRFLHAQQIKSFLGNVSYKSRNGAHKVNLREIQMGVEDGAGSISLQHLTIHPLTPDEDSTWLELAIDSISLNGIHTSEVPSGNLMIDHVDIEQPFFVLHTTPAAKQDTSTTTNKSETKLPDLYPYIQNHLNNFQVNNLNLTGGDFRFSGLGGSYYGLHIPVLEIAVEDLHIAPGSAFTEDRFLHASELQLNLQDIHYLFPDDVYSLQLDQAKISTSQRNVELNGLRYVFSENYEKKLAEDSTNEVYRLSNKKLIAREVNLEKLLLGKGFESESMLSEGLDLYVYKDFNVPYVEQKKPMPADMVLGVNLPLLVKRLILRDMEVTYEEMKKGADTAGFVKIEQLNGTIHNLTNVDSILQEKPSMEVVASGRLMGKGYFQSHINVPLLDKTQKVRVTGTMDTLDITELNTIARYNSRIAIKSGSFYKVSWDFEAGEELANGSMEVSYEDLKVQLSSPNSPDTTGFLKDVGSFLINLLVVDSNIAEEKNKKPEEVTFEQKRDKERSFFHFYVQSLLAGFIEAIGVPFN